MKECICLDTSQSWFNALISSEVYRVNWLRERHRLHQWEEEVKQVQTDMELAENWFGYQIKKWQAMAEAQPDILNVA